MKKQILAFAISMICLLYIYGQNPSTRYALVVFYRSIITNESLQSKLENHIEQFQKKYSTPAITWHEAISPLHGCMLFSLSELNAGQKQLFIKSFSSVSLNMEERVEVGTGLTYQEISDRLGGNMDIVTYKGFVPRFIAGNLIDDRYQTAVRHERVVLYKESGNNLSLMGADTTDNLGRFHFEDLAPGWYQLKVSARSFEPVVISHIYTDGNIELCYVHLYEPGIEWDGTMLDSNNQEVITGGYEPGFLEKKAENGRVSLTYFCKETVTGLYEDHILRIDYRNAGK
jgi:hypothetical protein